MPKTVSKEQNSQPDETLTQKLARLDDMTEWFYSDDFSLDEALEHYRRAMALTQEIEQDLVNLKHEVELLADFTKE